MVTAALIAERPARREQWRIGLRGAALEAGLHIPSDRLSGIEYSPLTLGDSQIGSFDPCEAAGVSLDDRDPTVSFLGWGIYAWEDCPVLGGGALGIEEAYARAAAKLERQTSHLAEKVLWTGALDVGTSLETLATTITPNADNRRLASDLAVLFDGGGPHDLTDALGHLCEYAASVAGGERLWIHVAPQLVPFLAFYGLAIRDTARSVGLTIGDHRVIVGSGYDGSGPPAEVTQSGESWIYLTTPVRFYESPVTPPAADVGMINRETNRNRAVVSRLVLAEWDLTVHGGIRVCTPPVGAECSTTGS